VSWVHLNDGFGREIYLLKSSVRAVEVLNDIQVMVITNAAQYQFGIEQKGEILHKLTDIVVPKPAPIDDDIPF
jgi:hypothetical protein